MDAAREIAAIARLEFAEVLRSRWLGFCVAVYLVLAGIFVLVGLRESTVLGFTGMGRVLLGFCHALLLTLPLLALSGTGQAVNRARDDGTLELLFAHPLGRGSWFAAVSITRYVALALPLVALVLMLAALARLISGYGVPPALLARAVGVSCALLLAYTGVGLAISTFTRSQARAATYVLLAWALGVALLDFAVIGVMLRFQLNARAVFLLAALNPVESARLALLSGAEPELPALGPVGFYLATRLDIRVLLALGLAWPTLVGLGAWTLSLRSFRREDLI